jgi:hypothetical protein
MIWHFISISYLAHEVIFPFWSLCYMSLESNKLLFIVFWQFLAKRSSTVTRAHSFASFAHATLCWPWNYAYMMMCDSASSHAFWFIVWHVMSTQVFLFKNTNSEISCYNFGHIHAWCQRKSFGWSLHLSGCTFVASTFVCSFLHMNFLLLVIIPFLSIVNHQFKFGVTNVRVSFGT